MTPLVGAADSDGSIASVAFYNGTTLIGSDTTAPYSVAWSNVATGSYSLTAKATDNQGAVTTSAPVTITVTDPPVAAGVYYLYADHLNTPRVVTDGTNKIVWRWDSDPFGTDTANEDPDGDGKKFRYNQRFPGQYYDRETGLHYNYFRDYDPGTGRYPQADPIGLAGGMNLYLYANAAPTMLIDPLGLTGGPPMKGTYYPRGNMPSPAMPSKNDPGSWDGAVDATNGFMCALGVKSACIPDEVFICVEWECTPECGKPYRLERYSKTPSFTNPDTPCVCKRKGLNPNYDGRLPGL